MSVVETKEMLLIDADAELVVIVDAVEVFTTGRLSVAETREKGS
jgi:hypothetical protein